MLRDKTQNEDLHKVLIEAFRTESDNKAISPKQSSCFKTPFFLPSTMTRTCPELIMKKRVPGIPCSNITLLPSHTQNLTEDRRRSRSWEDKSLNKWFLDRAEIIKDFAGGFIEKLGMAVRFRNSSCGKDDSGIEEIREMSASFLVSETDKHLPICFNYEGWDDVIGWVFGLSFG